MNILDELQKLATEKASQMDWRFGAETRPRIAQLLAEYAIIEARSAAGEDVNTARVAIEASFANLTLEERSRIVVHGRDLIFNFAVRLIAGAASAG